MIALLMKAGLSARFAKIVAYVGIPLLILLAFYLALQAYGNSRYREGVKDERGAWQEAETKLLKKAGEAANDADKKAAAREADHAAAVEEEREKIDEAVAEGRSPFDVLFGADSR